MSDSIKSAPQRIISAAEVANYVVCPEAWRLKYVVRAKREEAPRTVEGIQRRQEWIEGHNLITQLKRYAKVAYVLLLLLFAVAFLWDQKQTMHLRFSDRDLGSAPGADANSEHFTKTFFRLLTLPFGPHGERVFSEAFGLLIVLGLLIFMWDLFDRRARALRKRSGVGEHTEMLAVRGSSGLPEKQYISQSLGLASKPDAVIREEGHIIPVDYHPMSGKVKDRHVIQLLVHLRLIEELEGKSPPYGILLMGNKRKSVRVKNTAEKRRWLESLLDEMRSILNGVPAAPAPAYAKCRSCDVRRICEHSAYRDDRDKTASAKDETTDDDQS